MSAFYDLLCLEFHQILLTQFEPRTEVVRNLLSCRQSVKTIVTCICKATKKNILSIISVWWSHSLCICTLVVSHSHTAFSPFFFVGAGKRVWSHSQYRVVQRHVCFIIGVELLPINTEAYQTC